MYMYIYINTRELAARTLQQKPRSDMPRMAAVRRINELIRRARLALAHALLCATLRYMMPSLWGRDKATISQKQIKYTCTKNMQLFFRRSLYRDFTLHGKYTRALTLTGKKKIKYT